MPIQCQEISPFWGVERKETLFSAQLNYEIAQLWNSMTVKQLNKIVLQFNYQTAKLWNSTNVRWPSGKVVLRWVPLMTRYLCPALVRSALLCLLCSRLVGWDVFGVSGLAGKTHASIFGKRESTLSELTGVLTYIERIPLPWLLIGSFSCKWGLQIFSFTSPKSTVLIGQSRASLIGQWKC